MDVCVCVTYGTWAHSKFIEIPISQKGVLNFNCTQSLIKRTFDFSIQINSIFGLTTQIDTHTHMQSKLAPMTLLNLFYVETM